MPVASCGSSSGKRDIPRTGFIEAGGAFEYGLSSAAHPHRGLTIALLPLVAIAGTVTGSFVWGAPGDRICRRAAIILAAALHDHRHLRRNAQLCLEPDHALHDGRGAGGMLPLTYTLVAESVPARHRGWLMVLIGGLATGAAKAGGVSISALVVAAIAAPSIRTTALLGAIPLALAAVAIAMAGAETCGRHLEEITSPAPTGEPPDEETSVGQQGARSA